MRIRWRAALAGSVVLTSTVWTPAPVGADDDEYVGAIPGEYIVELDAADHLDEVVAALGLVDAPEPLGDGSPIYLFQLDPATAVADTVARLANTGGVVAAQPNLIQDSVGGLGLRKGFFGDVEPATVIPVTPAYTLDQPGLAWPATPNTAGAGSTVAVLDTGVDTSHPALADRLLPGVDVVDDDADPSELANGIDDNGNGTVDEAFGHGTYVAGLVAIIAPSARLLPIRVLDSDGTGSAWDVMQGVAHATSAGANIINMSLGGPTGGPIAARVMDRAQAHGAILVAAAGNDASDTPTYPAAFDGVVSVAAIDARDGSPALFSNRGSWIDLAAPGVAIVSTYPGGRFAEWGGTSAAAPLVAGLIAAVRASYIGAPSSDVIAVVTGTASADLVSGLSSYGAVVPAAAAQRRP